MSIADSGTDEGLESWCTYVLEGLKSEIDKIDRLLDYTYLKEYILLPSLEHSKVMRHIDDTEYKILKLTIENQVIQNSDIQAVLKGRHMTSISRYIRTLRDKRMLAGEQNNARKYHISFINNFLLRSVIRKLEEQGFIPMKLDEKGPERNKQYIQ